MGFLKDKYRLHKYQKHIKMLRNLGGKAISTSTTTKGVITRISNYIDPVDTMTSYDLVITDSCIGGPTSERYLLLWINKILRKEMKKILREKSDLLPSDITHDDVIYAWFTSVSMEIGTDGMVTVDVNGKYKTVQVHEPIPFSGTITYTIDEVKHL